MYYYPHMYGFRQDDVRQHETNTLIVTGNGSIFVEPDSVSIRLAVVTENQSLQEAQQENAQTMEQVIQSLLNVGIRREDIQTSAYNIFPRYDFMEGKQTLRGYEVTNEITIHISEMDQAGMVIDTAVQNGVNRVSDIEFIVSDMQSSYQRALVEALQDAQVKAQTIAETMQINLIQPPRRIVEKGTTSPSAFKVMAATAESFTTPVEPGEMEISAIIEVQYVY